MSQTSSNSARKAALARRIAMSQGGKKAMGSSERTRSDSANTSSAVSTPAQTAAPVANYSAPQSQGGNARKAALARRIAMSQGGKKAMGNSERTRSDSAKTAPAVSTPAQTAAPVANYSAPQRQGGNARKAALARRIAMSKGGKAAVASTDRTNSTAAAKSATNTERKDGCGCGCGGKDKPAETTATTSDMSFSAASLVATPISPNLKKVGVNPTRAATLSRRKAMSTRGKAALKGGTVSEASAARAANPDISSRELAQTLRTQRSQKGKTSSSKSTKTVATGPGRHRKVQDAAQDAPWKVGVTETSSGQAVTGTMVDRTEDVTGTEASACRGITGTEYMGADVFKDYCQKDAAPAFNRVSVTSTGTGNRVSGNNVSRSASVTGNEPGTCKAVTGTEYVSTEQAQDFCASKGPTKPAKISIAETAKGKSVTGNNVGRSDMVTGDEPGSDRVLTGSQYMSKGQDSAPNKVAISSTLRGGSVSGTTVGRSNNVTGDEPGSCRNVTGDDYVSAEQYTDFCKSAPAPTDQKVGVSSTLMGKNVTGTMTDRGGNVTGNEAGTCKALTGTPYVGAAQTEAFCASPEKAMAMARANKGTGNVGAAMTGIQPGIAGVMTGDSKGACEPLTGTPYVGADQAAQACPATAATTASPDFPQAMGGQPWGDFSVSSPAGAAQEMIAKGGITGAVYENSHITGPFGMADGKVTGTEEARFGGAQAPVQQPVAMAQELDGRAISRVTGEGQAAGLKITGDDWDRGDHVTGTEGTSAARRNPTIRGNMTPMAVTNVANKRNEEVALPMSKVTGSSGNTEQGSLITYSGGARG